MGLRHVSLGIQYAGVGEEGREGIALLGKAATVSSECPRVPEAHISQPARDVLVTVLPDQTLVPGFYDIFSPFGEADNPPSCRDSKALYFSQ